MLSGKENEMSFKRLREEIEAKDWLKKHLSKKSILKYIVILFVICLVWDFNRYCGVCSLADDIYPEILSNLSELHLIITQENKSQNIDYSKYKLILSTYDKGVKTNKKIVDRQITNFYTNLKKIEVLKNKEDFEKILDQGEDVKYKLNYYFGCQDYFDDLKEMKNRPRVASQNTAVCRLYLRNYFRYWFL
ncbi:MAG: hypothetical protein KAS46_00585 [Candidatus Aureabacteria bacterium]|nr:hypothetical protein [Candidatus Auribacterota bacterium]